MHTEGAGGPYIMALVEQVGDIERLLRDNRVSFWVDADAISLDGNPAISVVNLGRVRMLPAYNNCSMPLTEISCHCATT